MAINPYINLITQQSEQTLIEDITIEIIQGMGQDCYYVPRKYLNIDRLFGENPASSFEKAYIIEMYIQSFRGFEGTDVITQFGVEVKDKITLIMSRKRFKEQVTINDSNIIRPREGDLIYFPLSKSLFEINFVEHENPLYPLGKLYSYQITAELFTYSYETMTTNNPDINIPYTTTDADNGGEIVPKNNVLGTTVGINYLLEDEAEDFGFDGNSPSTTTCDDTPT
jgi:hypothetical protein